MANVKLVRIRANRTKPLGIPVNTAPAQARVVRIARRGRTLFVGNYFDKLDVKTP